VLDGIKGGLSGTLIWQAVAIAAIVFAVRFLWMDLVPVVQRALRRGRGSTSGGRPARLVLGWSGMRGAVSLAIALAIPLRTSAGAPFPQRAQVVFFSYAAVLITLVLPGFTLGPLVRRLGLQRAGERARRMAEARSAVYQAALERIDELAADDEVDEDLAGRLRHLYEGRVERLATRLAEDGHEHDGAAQHSRARRAVIAAERDRLAELGAAGSYPADLLRDIQHELDLEESRIR
jgi:monovalent cation/hydrogen antiporter